MNKEFPSQYILGNPDEAGFNYLNRLSILLGKQAKELYLGA